jgi:hypothetical protein
VKSKRITSEDLAMARTLVPDECIGLLALVDAMVSELQMRRAADRHLVWLKEHIWAEAESAPDGTMIKKAMAAILAITSDA